MVGLNNVMERAITSHMGVLMQSIFKAIINGERNSIVQMSIWRSSCGYSVAAFANQHCFTNINVLVSLIILVGCDTVGCALVKILDVNECDFNNRGLAVTRAFVRYCSPNNDPRAFSPREQSSTAASPNCASTKSGHYFSSQRYETDVK